ncbi:MAG TPA: neutral zinc metallopeptidase [Candidatus Dormibacteraeota bacterium]|nr:neutral zinc metallopeptidase [Candidatus Dormibacteraeota bacterium]
MSCDRVTVTFDPGKRLDPSQVEDRRGGAVSGGPIVIGGGAIGLLLFVAAVLLGVDPFAGTAPQAPVDSQQTVEQCRTGADANNREECRVVGFVDSIQAYWSDDFARRGASYAKAPTVLYSGYVQGACGLASAAQGPFFCPLDDKVYLDVSFFQDLRSRFGAQGGSLAEGYVVAHEYGHHVEYLLGLLSNDSSRQASIRTELMADCLAGVWAKHATETGYLQSVTDADIAAALDAAGAVGDDRIQRETQGRVTPETWTHGSSAQRQQSFRAGVTSGDVATCTRA